MLSVVHVPINASVRSISLWWWDTLALDLFLLLSDSSDTTMANSGEENKPTFRQKVGQQCTSFGHFLYNSETGEVMGRSGRSWGKCNLKTIVSNVYHPNTALFVRLVCSLKIEVQEYFWSVK